MRETSRDARGLVAFLFLSRASLLLGEGLSMSEEADAAAMAVDADAALPHYGPDERRSPVHGEEEPDGSGIVGAQTTCTPPGPTNDATGGTAGVTDASAAPAEKAGEAEKPPATSDSVPAGADQMDVSDSLSPSCVSSGPFVASVLSSG